MRRPRSGATGPVVSRSSAIGVFWFYRSRFFKIAFNPDQAAAEGVNVRWWDFLFYTFFGFVVTSAVHIAGVRTFGAALLVALILNRLLRAAAPASKTS